MHNVLTARDGYIYTNGETYAYTIRLGINDCTDNWYEITEEAYAEKVKAEENGGINNDHEVMSAEEEAETM